LRIIFKISFFLFFYPPNYDIINASGTGIRRKHKMYAYHINFIAISIKILFWKETKCATLQNFSHFLSFFFTYLNFSLFSLFHYKYTQYLPRFSPTKINITFLQLREKHLDGPHSFEKTCEHYRMILLDS